MSSNRCHHATTTYIFSMPAARSKRLRWPALGIRITILKVKEMVEISV
jgi:hypothetical protein